MQTNNGKNRGYLWMVLFLIIFINGFEAGGYQASLWSIGKDFDLSKTSMGLYAAMELFATNDIGTVLMTLGINRNRTPEHEPGSEGHGTAEVEREGAVRMTDRTPDRNQQRRCSENLNCCQKNRPHDTTYFHKKTIRGCDKQALAVVIYVSAQRR